MNQLSFLQEPEGDHLLSFHKGVNTWKDNHDYKHSDDEKNCGICNYSVYDGLYFCQLIKLGVGLSFSGKQHKGIVNSKFICNQWRGKE